MRAECPMKTLSFQRILIPSKVVPRTRKGPSLERAESALFGPTVATEPRHRWQVRVGRHILSRCTVMCRSLYVEVDNEPTMNGNARVHTRG